MPPFHHTRFFNEEIKNQHEILHHGRALNDKLDRNLAKTGLDWILARLLEKPLMKAPPLILTLISCAVACD